MYSIISDATHENRSERNHNIQITNNGNEFMNDKEKANLNKNYFVNVGVDMSKKSAYLGTQLRLICHQIIVYP